MSPSVVCVASSGVSNPGRSRVAEEVADAGRSQDLHQDGGDVHPPRILPKPGVGQKESGQTRALAHSLFARPLVKQIQVIG